MYKQISILALTIAAVVGLPDIATSEETRIDVRVISKGAKFIGTSMGGAEIMITDAVAGTLLAQGKTSGSTGDTAKIMKEPSDHHAPVSTADAAVFRATLDLDEPRRIKVVAHGPLAQPQAVNTVSLTQWVIPGKHITGGDALMLEMPGFAVDILSPPAHQKLTEPVASVDLEANVTMMCGCPIEPGGLWDADQFEVAAIVKRNGKTVAEVPLRYAGSTSQFAGSLEVDEPGAYEITVYAFDPANGNTGVDKTSFIVTRE
jgi:hypothetical protein